MKMQRCVRGRHSERTFVSCKAIKAGVDLGVGLGHPFKAGSDSLELHAVPLQVVVIGDLREMGSRKSRRMPQVKISKIRGITDSC